MKNGNIKPKFDEEPVIKKGHLSYKLDDGIGWRARIGLIVLPDDQTIEYELRLIFNLPGIACYVNRQYCEPSITPETLIAMESEITRSADLILPGLPLNVVAYGCTSGALFIGPDRVHSRIQQVHRQAICTTPIEAATAALTALNARSIAMITPYTDDINQALRNHIQNSGVKVPIMGSWNEPVDARVGCISPESIRKVVLDLGCSDRVDTVFISCTNLRALDILVDAETKLGKSVISSNQVLGWHCLRLAGVKDRLPRFGSLFKHSIF